MNASLVGVLHGKSRNGFGADLLSPECKNEFMRTISPALNDRSLLVIEGRWTKLFTKDSWQYLLRHKIAEGDLGVFKRGPALVWRDPRTRIFSRDMTYMHVAALYTSIIPAIAFDDGPLNNISSLDEFSERARDGTLPIRVTRPLTSDEHKRVAALTYTCKKFDEAMCSAASGWASGSVFIVTGAIHTMTLHLRTGVPSVCLADMDRKKKVLALAALTGIALPIKLGLW